MTEINIRAACAESGENECATILISSPRLILMFLINGACGCQCKLLYIEVIGVKIVLFNTSAVFLHLSYLSQSKPFTSIFLTLTSAGSSSSSSDGCEGEGEYLLTPVNGSYLPAESIIITSIKSTNKGVRVLRRGYNFILRGSELHFITKFTCHPNYLFIRLRFIYFGYLSFPIPLIV